MNQILKRNQVGQFLNSEFFNNDLGQDEFERPTFVTSHGRNDKFPDLSHVTIPLSSSFIYELSEMPLKMVAGDKD